MVPEVQMGVWRTRRVNNDSCGSSLKISRSLECLSDGCDFDYGSGEGFGATGATELKRMGMSSV